jgi:hypothetical protein
MLIVHAFFFSVHDLRATKVGQCTASPGQFLFRYIIVEKIWAALVGPNLAFFTLNK